MSMTADWMPPYVPSMPPALAPFPSLGGNAAQAIPALSGASDVRAVGCASQNPALASLPMVGQPQSVTLTNGANSWLQQLPSTKRASLSILLPIGESLPGAQNMLPALLLAGLDEAKQYLNQLSAQGINVAVTPSAEKLLLNFSAPSGQEPLLIQTAMRILCTPKIDPQTFANIQQDTVKNLQKLWAEPEVRLEEQVNQNLFGPNHPYGQGVGATVAQTQGQTPQSVMRVYQAAMAAPGQATVLLMSSLPVAQQQQLLNQGVAQAGWFADPYRAAALPQTPVSASVPAAVGPLRVTDPTMQRTHLIAAWRAPMLNDPDYPAFLVLFNILNGFSGRFFQTLRTGKGLVYSTSQAYQPRPGGAHYVVATDVDSNKEQEGLDAIQQVIRGDATRPGVCNSLVSPQELERAKQSYILSVRSASQTPESLLDMNLSRLSAGLGPLTPEALITAISGVTAADVYRVAQRVFGPGQGRQVIGVAGPERNA